MLPPLGIDADPAATLAATMTNAAVATVASALATATATPSINTLIGDETQGECRLMGPFALVVQAALGGLAMLSLVYKRWRERPQRPVKIWFFDVSKQVFGSVLVHIANVFMSMLTSGRFDIKVDAPPAQRLMTRADDDYKPNPCSFYLLNLAIDTTLGIPILIILLRITTGLVSYTPLGKPAESIQSGHYGSPPNAWWWLKQSFIYFIGLFGMKVCVLIIFIMIPDIAKVGDWALSWTEGNERLQIAFSMMIFPLIMNAVQYYIIDSFIKKKEVDHELLPSEDPDDRDSRRYDDADELRSEDGDTDGRSRHMKIQARVRNSVGDEYDPDVDGDSGTIVGSTSSRRFVAGARGSPKLLPKE